MIFNRNYDIRRSSKLSPLEFCSFRFQTATDYTRKKLLKIEFPFVKELGKTMLQTLTKILQKETDFPMNIS